MKILRLLLSKRISKLEHVIHIGITLGTSGWWGIVYLLRALIYGNLKRAENSNSENGSSRVVSRVSTGKIGTYTKEFLHLKKKQMMMNGESTQKSIPLKRWVSPMLEKNCLQL